MARTPNIYSSLLLNFIFIMYCTSRIANAQGLKVGFYSKSCPNAEAIVKKTIDDALVVDPTLSGPLLRMFYHDCFVRGCDASILLNSTTNQAEKDAIPNLSLRGFDIIDKAKSALEEQCKGVVSCADIVALTARDVTVARKGRYWEVETGRRDGNISNISDALKDLIPPSANITTLKADFKQRGLSVKDLVVLTGGHTLGVSHCTSFSNRIYNFTGNGNADPSMDPSYVQTLRTVCKPGDQNTTIGMDTTPLTFDANYYAVVAERRGLFESDTALLNDPQTRFYVKLRSISRGFTFNKDFGRSMVNMGRIEVLTGTNGEIRKVCSKIN